MQPNFYSSMVLGSLGLWLQAPKLSGSTAYEKPLVDGAVNLAGGEFLVGRQRRQLVRRQAVGGVCNSGVGAGMGSETARLGQ